VSGAPLGWLGIVRLGLVQAALGSVVVLATSTMNRVMVVEIALPAIVPGLLVALHYAVQVLRPRLGYGSDQGGRRSPWILGGMAVLAAGGVVAALATAWMTTDRPAGIALAVVGFGLIGVGVGAAGTTLLVLLAKQVAPGRQAAAASIVWIMMIAGFGLTAGLAGRFLDPFSPARLVAVTTVVSAASLVITLLALWGLERTGSAAAGPAPARPAAASSFREALAQVWAEPQARAFALFVFISMLAYSAQELILEPYAGAVFGLTPGQSTSLTGLQHGGALVGMLLVALVGSFGGRRLGSLRHWARGGCLASALALLGLALAGPVGPAWPLRANVLLLGIANGAFAVAAIGSMMGLVTAGRESREGVRMGVWGAAQGLAFGAGGLLATAASDLARGLLGSAATAYAAVFVAEALLFLIAAGQAARVFQGGARPAPAMSVAEPVAAQGGTR
jgi:BCD family chlorophyll transporter-like MFS transporter